MLSRLRQITTRAADRLDGRKLVAGAVVLLAAAAGAAVAYLLTNEDDPGELRGGSPAPNVLIEEAREPERIAELGFPAFATKNTTRVGGGEAAANAAAIALTVHPSSGGVKGPPAVSLVGAGDWAAAVAAGSLVAEPVGAPVLVGDSDEVPDLTAEAIGRLRPEGSSDTAGRSAFALGDVEVPRDVDAIELRGSDPAEIAAEVEGLRRRLVGKPRHLVVVSSEDPAFSVPAASWAARSGDPVLFAERDRLPAATRKVLEANERTPVYVLGPEAAISKRTVGEIEDVVPNARRIAGDDPVANAIAFAREASGSFGWDINDPGHGFVVAPADRPLDAAVSAPLSASGTWGPLLLSDESETLPAPLRGYLLDLKPGYESDPTRALYNHVWLVGDTEALSVDLQAELDEVAEVAPVSSGGGGGGAAAQPPAEPESQPDDDGGGQTDEEEQR